MKTPYKMKGSPMARNYGAPFKTKETTQTERDAMTPAQRLLKVVPDKATYNKLTATEKISFDRAAKKAGLPMKKT